MQNNKTTNNKHEHDVSRTEELCLSFKFAATAVDIKF